MKTVLVWGIVSLLVMASLYIASFVLIAARGRAVAGPTRSGISPSEWGAPYLPVAGDAVLVWLLGLVYVGIYWMLATKLFPVHMDSLIPDLAMKISLTAIPLMLSALYALQMMEMVYRVTPLSRSS